MYRDPFFINVTKNVIWLTVPWDPNKISSNFWINERFQIFLVTLDSTFTKTILRAQITVYFALLNTFQMSQSFDWYNSVLQLLIENYRTSIKNKVYQFSDRNIRNTKILFTL